MGQDCEDWLDMCLDSVKDADQIIYVDGGSSDGSVYMAQKEGVVISNDYVQDDPDMNGKQRNFYLDYLKKNFDGWWCLVLDADEIVEDFSKVKEFIESTIHQNILYSPRMRHLIGDFCHEDASQPVHFVSNRLFKVSKKLFYPLGEHVILSSEDEKVSNNFDKTTIWHLPYAPMFHVKKRYDKNLKHSNVHTKKFLKNWYYWHLFGSYPKKQFNPVELPQQLLDKFNINRDELYFANRGLEHKHWLDAVHWREFFKCENALEFGAGRGPRVFAMNKIGIETLGVELSQWAVKTRIDNNIIEGDILSDKDYGKHDLVLAYDLLEHIDIDDLSKAIDNILKHSKKHVLISVPALGDPNLENDPTHKIHRPMNWWQRQFTEKGCKLLDTPENFLFKHQLIVLEVPNEKSSED